MAVTTVGLSSDGRISIWVFQILISMFYALALIGAATRLILQIKVYWRLYLDDYLLVNACICLTISTILGFVYVDTLYRGQDLNMEPKRGLETVTCFDPFHMKIALVMAVIEVILDIGTDMLTISLSFCLLWKVRIKPRQKLFLGIFLSLNIFMAIVACVRVSGLEINATFDEIWLFVWQQIEACVAVAMLSGTAFRSIFVSSASSRARRGAGGMP
ncbi:hypothetical protein MMC13_000443 [Lambiella insularis]|nr:hypothetical protein [Lambiella insularis]